MKKLFLFLLFGIAVIQLAVSQNYTIYFTGNDVDIVTEPTGGVCLMGGATEDDNAMTWFLEQASGGDILVLRASGSDGYNDYLYSDLGIDVNSVETIVFNNAFPAIDPYIHQKIQQAEAIWFAGGDQWNYVNYWRNTAIDSLINEAITERNIVVGGTSAGMAILGGFYFSAQNGTVSSAAALANPYNNNVTVDSLQFITANYLSDVITDTHYDDPDRKGRHIVFLSRILVDYGIAAKGIACDEYVAVCIDNTGIARVYGGYPEYDDNAYFIQINCELASQMPEDCSSGNPLDWNLGNEAIKVYHVTGTIDGSNYLDLNNWETGVGGTWEDWHVDSGVLNELPGSQPDCSLVSVEENEQYANYSLFPNPAENQLTIQFSELQDLFGTIQIRNTLGQIVKEHQGKLSTQVVLDISELSSGLYLIEINCSNKKFIQHKVVID